MAGHQELLASVPLFAKMNRKSLDRLDRIIVQREFSAGTEIVREGDTGAGFFIIQEGTAEIVRSGGVLIATISVGDFFGDMALLDGHPRVATVRAKDNVTCLVMTRWDFLAEVRGNPDIAQELLEQLSLRIRELERRLSEAAAAKA